MSFLLFKIVRLTSVVGAAATALSSCAAQLVLPSTQALPAQFRS